jgi:hypothetical protein
MPPTAELLQAAAKGVPIPTPATHADDFDPGDARAAEEVTDEVLAAGRMASPGVGEDKQGRAARVSVRCHGSLLGSRGNRYDTGGGGRGAGEVRGRWEVRRGRRSGAEAEDACGDTDRDGAIGQGAGHHGSGADNTSAPDIGENDRPCADPGPGTDADLPTLPPLFPNRSIWVVEKVGLSPGRDQDMSGQEDIAFQMNPTQKTAWTDVNVFFQDGAGLGKEGAELYQGCRVTVGEHLLEEGTAEVLTTDARQQGEELGGGFQGAVRPEEEALEAVEQQQRQDQQGGEEACRGFEPTFDALSGRGWCSFHVTILRGIPWWTKS